MKLVECTQGTPDWLQARAGHVTSSRVADVLARIKTGEAATRRNYKAQLVAEILVGGPVEEGYVSASMLAGNELEPLARASYEIAREVSVDQVGFVLHPKIARAGCSPDGLVGVDGLVEIKCPKTATHLGYILSGNVPSEYQPQMLWQMACTGRAWCDFVSYDPKLPEHLQLFVKRLARDDQRIADMEAEVRQFLKEVNALIAQLPTSGDDEPLTRVLRDSIANLHITDTDVAEAVQR